MKIALKAARKVAKDLTYFNKSVLKAKNLGLVEGMHPNTLKAPLKPAAPPCKINADSIGVILSDGTLKFQTEEQAIEFGKRKIVSALNQSFPIEVNVEISKNGRVLGVMRGDGESCRSLFEKHPELKKDAYIQMHGHPDFKLGKYYGTGYTTAPSPCDYGLLAKNEYLKKMIVFNSDGEHCILTKLQGVNKETYDALADTIDKDFSKVAVPGLMDEMVYGYTRREVTEEYKRLLNVYKKQFAKQKTASGEELEKIEQGMKDFLEKSDERIYAVTKSSSNDSSLEKIRRKAEKLRKELESDKFMIKQSHEFWPRYAQKYKVKFEEGFYYWS